MADYSAVIDSVIAMANKEDSNSQDAEYTKKVVDPESVPKLPPSLPTVMEEIVNQLKMVSNMKLESFQRQPYLNS